ncbi:Crp/Fnr family transcriptional regulator [Parafrankia sp. BMG5.11]|uniref:Crp/Fnr family transcriptional regulator n=1 Tax=Parafrankia sp. BMG5.11 TaxID=222540 RepID=UPI001038BFF3|nr:helix-turn-helix domain-containing protein [Parafrankia sp. BMG5.11]TCJ39081.1 cyclic nucleotide-binding domain-containing protein [Parafrankia sp. BMG5.11]
MSYIPRGPLTDLPTGHPCADCPVRPVTICRTQTPEVLAALRGLGTMQRLQEGQTVFHEGDPARRVFMLTYGSLKIYTLLLDGRRQVTGFMFPGDFLGVAVEGEYAFTIEALEGSELWWFSRDAFTRFVDQNPSIERELYHLSAHELAAAQQQMVLLGRKTAAERLASFFFELLERQERAGTGEGQILDLPMNRLDIADYLGLTKETVSRMLAELRSRGLIRLAAQNRVEVLDHAGLIDLAQGSGGNG